MADIDFLKRTTDKIYSEEELHRLLDSGKQLRIKYGVDVTAPFLHIGHAVNLWMMRWLQEKGHKVVFLIGDFTTKIGDPTGKSKTRKVIDPETISKNAEEFIAQVGQVLLTEPEVFEVRRNGEWYDEMALGDFFKLLGRVTHGQLVQRDMFQKRITNGDPIHMHEFLYPLLQGWDSVELDSDLTIVGSDQLFNEGMGRTFQAQEGQKPQVIITTKITAGTDGKEKQSKSLGNYIALADTPRDKFGKIMKIPDNLIFPYFEVYTDAPMITISSYREQMQFSGTNPMGIKKELAWYLVKRYHGKEAADQERQWFDDTFAKKQTPDDIPTVLVKLDSTVLDVLKVCQPEASVSHLRRLLKQGAIKADGEKLADNVNESWDFSVNVLKVGKRSWFKVGSNKES
jgi:tyrosyl-tRNA synthetase